MITVPETAHLAIRPPVILLEGRLPVLETPAVESLGLRDGQVVRPTVEVRDGQVRLVLQDMAIALPPSLQLAVGDRPAFRVRLDASGRVTLQLLADGADEEVQPPGMQPPSTTAGRVEQLLLRPPGMPSLAALFQPGALQALFQAAPQAAVAGFIQQMVRQWPSTSQLTPEVLRRMMRQGGWTQEAALARAGTAAPVEPDIKSLLRILLAQWNQAPESTRQVLRESLDDIEARQLQAVADPTDGREWALSMLLPFVDAEPVQVRWSHRDDAGQGEGGGAPWVVDMHTRSSALGEVWLRTQVTQGMQVQLVMWAERADLVARARAASASLAAWLNEAGLRMTGLQVIHGAPPVPFTAEPVAAGSGRLVDVQA